MDNSAILQSFRLLENHSDQLHFNLILNISAIL